MVLAAPPAGQRELLTGGKTREKSWKLCTLVVRCWLISCCADLWVKTYSEAASEGNSAAISDYGRDQGRE